MMSKLVNVRMFASGARVPTALALHTTSRTGVSAARTREEAATAHTPHMQVVEDFGDLHLRAWEALAAEEGKPVPPRWMLRRADGMKNEQVRFRHFQ